MCDNCEAVTILSKITYNAITLLLDCYAIQTKEQLLESHLLDELGITEEQFDMLEVL